MSGYATTSKLVQPNDEGIPGKMKKERIRPGWIKNYPRWEFI